jgi:uncharacterized protein YndB with AHSA1/START domain
MTSSLNDPRPDFVYVIYISAPQDKVWDAITDENLTQQYFFKVRVRSDWRIGSTVQLVGPSGQVTDSGVVLTCEPTHLLSYTWTHFEDKAEREQPSAVEFKLDTIGATTRLTLTHRHLVAADYAALDDAPNGLNNGWPMVLSSLKTFLETGHGPKAASEAVVDGVRAAR